MIDRYTDLTKKDIPAFDCTLGLWFSEKMNFPLTFLVAILVLFMANCAESENDCKISDSEAIKAATDAMKNCNSNIKHCFDVHEGKGVAKLYCKGMMVRFLCPLSAAFLSLFFVVDPFGGSPPPPPPPPPTHHFLTLSPLYISFVFGSNRKGSRHWVIKVKRHAMLRSRTRSVAYWRRDAFNEHRTKAV